MKTLSIFLLGTFMVVCALAQENQEENQPGPKITFEEESRDFGDIYQGDKIQHTYVFENTGDEPLILTNVQTTCGCTVPQWPRDPIAPGQQGKLEVVFNSSGKIGRQNKVITVISNAVNSTERITLITNVLPKKKESEQ
ncbi:MAG: DUF1573 domain-containing protein [Bacteroidota bacterium]